MPLFGPDHSGATLGLVSQEPARLDVTDVEALRRTLLAWFETQARPLPWRDDEVSPWGIYLCEVMSQQTPVSRIAPVWRRWLDLWPTPKDLADAPTAAVIREWGTLGYPRRALWLQQSAAIMCHQHGGGVPRQYSELTALPGVGDYTASAVCAFAYGQSIPVLDTNVRRVLARIFLGNQRPASSAATQVERDLATSLLPAIDPAGWSVAIMEFGSITCRASNPRCGDCVVAQSCRWRRNGCPASGRTGRTQRFDGTDRQVRGRVMKVLRDKSDVVHLSDIEGVAPDREQVMRCLDTLIADGLVEPLPGSQFALPGQAVPVHKLN